MRSTLKVTCRNDRQGCAARVRRGAVLVAALVCMAIVMTMIGAMLLAVQRTGRQAHIERDLRQCEWLLEAGLDRAAYRLACEADYRGETWMLPSTEIVGSGDGQVTTEVSASTEEKRQLLRIVAEYPTGSECSIRRSRTIVLPFKTPSAQE